MPRAVPALGGEAMPFAGLKPGARLRTLTAMADSERKPEGFTVTDRRAFDTSGDRKQDVPTPDKPADPAAKRTPPTAAPQDQRAESEPERPLPPADFATLVLSLGSSAVAYLGEAPAGDDKNRARNLPMAKHAIDLLSVLEEKTKGNLSGEEQQILESLLFDLRLRYVEAIKPGSSTRGGG